ncbi:MAG: YcxB family protein [Cyclobacteriaceae bacterium]|nr:YcxB family protein [Cyclobacteriaceae bacterium]
MIIKTKNYRLDKQQYIKMALKSILLKMWWAIPIAVAICLLYLWIPSFWWIAGGVLAYGLFVLFWLIQFYGVTQLEQGKMLFEKFSYEINSQQILMKLNAREGMPLKWGQIQRAEVGKDYYLLFVNKAQLIHLPFKIFNTDNERKFLTSILRTKGLIK